MNATRGKRRISIARVISRLNVGGPSQHAILLAQSFQDGDFESHLISGIEDLSEQNMLGLAQARGVEVIRIPMMRRKIAFFADLRAFWRLYRLFRRLNVDIVHTHTAKAGALGRTAAILAGVPVILHTFHGHVLEGYFHPFVTRIFVWIERLLARRTDCIVTLSANLEEELRQRGIQGRFGMRVIPLGLDLQRFAEPNLGKGSLRAELSLQKEDLLLGVVGRLVPIKRHEDLLRGLSQLHAAGQKIHLAIIGGGECEKPLRAQTQALGLTPWVHFCGFRQDLEEIYPALDLVVLPSANEGLPVCLIEAMACGIPVVATAVGGVRDLLSDSPSCRIVAPFQIDQLAGAIQNMLQEREGFREKAQSHRKRIIQRYGILGLVEALQQLYRDLVEKKCGS